MLKQLNMEERIVCNDGCCPLRFLNAETFDPAVTHVR